MFEKLLISRMAGALASHAAARQSVIARNVANADTPAYKAEDLTPFSRMVAEEGLGLTATRPGHLGAADPLKGAETYRRDAEAAPNGNTVSIEDEMIASAEVRQEHQMALGIYRSTSAILRTALGRTA